jgi:hypothetical protein
MTVLSAICGLFACVLGAYTMFYDTTNPTQSTAVGMFTYVDPVVPPFDYWRAMLGFCDWSSWWFDVPFTSFLYCTFPFVPYAYVWFYPTVEEEVRFAVTTVPLVEMTVLLLAVLVAILVVVNTRPRSRSPSRICLPRSSGPRERSRAPSDPAQSPAQSPPPRPRSQSLARSPRPEEGPPTPRGGTLSSIPRLVLLSRALLWSSFPPCHPRRYPLSIKQTSSHLRPWMTK